MQPAEFPEIDCASLQARVDPGSFMRGVRYAGQGAVAQLSWEPARSALQGHVRGSTGGFYNTIAYLSPGSRTRLRFSRGVCSCPVAADCKHVVALVLTAAAPASAEPEPVRAQDWQARMDSLLAPAPTAAVGAVPLAIELTLTRAGGPPELTARVVQQRGAGWVAGSLSWSKLDAMHYYGGYAAEQVRVLQQIHALSRYSSRILGRYAYSDERYIDLGAFESRQLWPLLDDADTVGIRLIHRGKLGDLPKYHEANVCVDVSDQPDGSLVVRAVVDGLPADAVPVRFIGSDGHGLVYSDRDPAATRIGLARLGRAVPPALQQMVLAGERLKVPAAARSAFTDGYFHRLSRTAQVSSLDGSFTPPVISGPALVLRAAYLGGHRVDVAWEWAYQVGTTALRFEPGGPGADDLRDPSAEQAIVAGLDGPVASLGLVSPGQADQPQVSAALLVGIDTMRFTTEVLPLLAGQPGIVTEITGEAADYREAGDSLRIGVSAGAIPGDADWFDLGITISVDGQAVPFADVFVALSQGKTHLLLPDGAYFALDKPELVALGRLIKEARALQDVPGDDLRISRFQAGLWDELSELGVVSHQSAAWRAQVTGLLAAGTLQQRQPPAGLRATLRSYQLDGFRWLAFLWENRLGGILADDMGLGKTLQSLALICHARHAEASSAPFLIVAPTSVVPNWAAEAAKFAPGLHVVPVTETQARRGQPLSELIAGADAIVTSYALLRIDIGSYAEIGWGGLILDEAQFAKNYHSRIYQCARRVRADCKLAITGTPMENNLMELWALLSITAPGLFPNPDRFREFYARPIERSGDAELLAQLRRRIRPLVMRRTKEQVASDLPAKQEQVLEVELHPRHRRLYELQLQRERQKVLGLIHDMNANRFMILRSLTLLRQLSLHAGLLDEAHLGVPSSKIDLLIDQLGDVLGAGHRALVFSQFTGFLALVRGELDARGIGYCYLDGKTRDRAAVIERFASGSVPLFLISLKAGGFGLNLTMADYCFLLDPWWNPATEAQAVDRTHRIGQTRNVMVYRLIAAGTIEQKVMALKARKAELFASVLDEGNVFGAGLDADDIRALLG
jgi:hypothetical protein